MTVKLSIRFCSHLGSFLKNLIMNQGAEYATEELLDSELEGLYFFSPSITKTRTVNGKIYTIRSYFAGDKDFNKTVTELAVKQAYDNKE